MDQSQLLGETEPIEIYPYIPLGMYMYRFEGEREREQIENLRSWLMCLCWAGKLKILKAGQLAANSGRISGFQTSDRFPPSPVQQGSAGISTSCSRGHLLVHILAKQTARLGECLLPFLVIQGCWCGS